MGEKYENLRETGFGGVYWINPDQIRHQSRALENTEMNLRVPQKARILLTSWATVIVSIRALLHGVNYHNG